VVLYICLMVGVIVYWDVERSAEGRREQEPSRRVKCVGYRGVRADVVEQVVLDEDPVRLLARIGVVLAEDDDAVRRVANDVVGEGDVFDRTPGTAAALVPRGEENGESVLPAGLGPVVLEDVPVHED